MTKCAICRAEFVKRSISHKACSWACAIELGNRASASRMRKEIKKQREKLKTRSEWLKEAQASFNAFIRERDKDLVCISCGRAHQGQWHAGHYRSVGAAPELRFEELNVHKQCAPCNNHRAGNVIEYRINLIKRIGIEKVEWLEGPQSAKKYTIEEAKNIKEMYKQKLKGLHERL